MPAQTQLKPVTMRGVRIIFRNFQGKETNFNPPGKKNFGVVLPDDIAEAMLADGWNVKYLDPREDDEDQVRTPWLPVEARYDNRPPKIMMITDRGQTALTADNVQLLDQADITNVDLIVNPSFWENKGSGKKGIKAYLKSMFVTIEEDELEKEYAELNTQ